MVSKVKALGLFAEGEVKNDKKALNQAYNAGEKLFKAINLRNKIMQQVGKGLFKK